ncbi:MAG: hypothetical protein D6773_10910 [Alphaproteobacteria bacterium]|nr:MAG: hypothetical protein D6773_10910 [Alphaproteobacteria bacterium]
MRACIEKHRTQPFAWGRSDCAMFADCVKAMTGTDPLKGLRGYKTKGGALKKLKRAGYASVAALVEDKFEEIPVAMAGRGDLAYPADVADPLMSPAVIDGANAFSKGPDGFIVVPRSAMARAFRV